MIDRRAVGGRGRRGLPGGAGRGGGFLALRRFTQFGDADAGGRHGRPGAAFRQHEAFSARGDGKAAERVHDRPGAVREEDDAAVGRGEGEGVPHGFESVFGQVFQQGDDRRVRDRLFHEVGQDAARAEEALRIIGFAEFGDDDARARGVDETAVGAGAVQFDEDGRVSQTALVAAGAEEQDVAFLQVGELAGKFAAIVRLGRDGASQLVAELVENELGKSGAVEDAGAVSATTVGGTEPLAGLIDDAVRNDGSVQADAVSG